MSTAKEIRTKSNVLEVSMHKLVFKFHVQMRWVIKALYINNVPSVKINLQFLWNTGYIFLSESIAQGSFAEPL